MRQDERDGFVQALQRARLAAYPPGELVAQESFMRAGKILALARQADITTGTSVLYLWGGSPDPAGSLPTSLGCTCLGVDHSASATAIA